MLRARWRTRGRSPSVDTSRQGRPWEAEPVRQGPGTFPGLTAGVSCRPPTSPVHQCPALRTDTGRPADNSSSADRTLQGRRPGGCDNAGQGEAPELVAAGSESAHSGHRELRAVVPHQARRGDHLAGGSTASDLATGLDLCGRSGGVALSEQIPRPSSGKCARRASPRAPTDRRTGPNCRIGCSKLGLSRAVPASLVAAPAAELVMRAHLSTGPCGTIGAQSLRHLQGTCHPSSSIDASPSPARSRALGAPQVAASP